MRLTTKGTFCGDRDDRPGAPRTAARSRSPPSASGSRFRFRTSSSCSASCAAHELVDSVRGPGGGYNLAQRDAGISPSPTSSSRSTSRSTRRSAAARKTATTTQRCMTHDLWATLNEQMSITSLRCRWRTWSPAGPARAKSPSLRDHRQPAAAIGPQCRPSPRARTTA